MDQKHWYLFEDKYPIKVSSRIEMWNQISCLRNLGVERTRHDLVSLFAVRKIAVSEEWFHPMNRLVPAKQASKWESITRMGR